jgi:hypothetical protein
VSDIFREVEEEVRRERVQKLWKQYGDYVIAVAALLIIAAAAYKLWGYYEQRAREKASNEYAAAQQLLESNRADQAATAFAKLADSAPSGYDVVARLQNADALAAEGNRDQAIALYKKIAAGDDPILASVARIREAWALVETAPRLQIETLLAPLTDPTNPWRFMAREILAYSDYRTGKLKAAQKEYETLAGETDAPIGVRQRANAMATFLKAGGDANFGTVPPPPTPPANNATSNAHNQGPTNK